MPNQTTPRQDSAFGDSNEIDPTPGWIPFVFVIGVSVLFLIFFVIAALFIR